MSPYFIFWVLMVSPGGGTHWDAHGTFETLEACQTTVAIFRYRQRRDKIRNPAVCLPEGTHPRAGRLL